MTRMKTGMWMLLREATEAGTDEGRAADEEEAAEASAAPAEVDGSQAVVPPTQQQVRGSCQPGHARAGHSVTCVAFPGHG